MENNSSKPAYGSNIPESLHRFCNIYNENHPGKNADLHNLYLIQTIDREGNITNEAYGMNLLTNIGFQSSVISDKYIFIGEGTGTPSITDNTLFKALTTTASTNTNTNEATYPLIFNSTTGIISQMKQIVTGYFDYTIFSEAKTITEIGIGSDVTNLYTHALIYDSDGKVSSITKNINERLYITVFWNICMKADVFNNAYTNGIYLLLQPANILNSAIYCYMSYINSLSYPIDNKNGFNMPNGTISNNIKTGNTISAPAIIIDKKHDYVTMATAYSTEYYGSMISTDRAFNSLLIFWKENLAEPEELISENIYTDSDEESYLTKSFLGRWENYDMSTARGEFPVDQFSITSVSMYNHIDKSWNITESFTDGPNSYFNYRTFHNALSLWITDNSGISRTVNVFVNDKTDIPIDSFYDSGITLYATDAFWDSSSWSLISNLSNVPTTLRTKRYFVCIGRTDNNIYLTPHRDQIYHKINISGQYYATKPSCPDINGDYYHSSNNIKMLASDTYDCITNQSYIIFHPNDKDTMIKYRIDDIPIEVSDQYSTLTSTSKRWIIGDKMVIAHYDINSTIYNRYLHIYDISDSSIFATSYTTTELNFTKGSIYSPFYSYNNGDFLTCQDTTNNEFIITKIHNSTGSYGANVSTHTLPNYLQEVDYITSNGTEYIDILYKPKATTKIEWDGIVYKDDNTLSNNVIFGVCYDYSNPSYPAHAFYTKYNGNYVPYLKTKAGTNAAAGTDFVYDTRVKVVTSSNKAVWYVDNIEKGNITSQYSFIDSGSSMYVFDSNISLRSNNGHRNGHTYAKASIYSFKIYENETLVADYVPCYRKSDNVIGLYNVTSGIFCPANNSTAQQKISNARNATTLLYTDQCVYRTSDGLTFNIINMNTSETVDSFEITDAGYTFDGIVGWKNYIFIRVINASSEYSTYIYDVNTKILSHQVSMNILGMTYSDSQIITANDECLVISNDYISNKTNYGVYIIQYDSPYTSKYQPIYTDLNMFVTSMDLKYYNDGKQFILLVNFYERNYSQSAIAVIDVGYIIDKGPYENYPAVRSMQTTNPAYNTSIGIAMFKGEIVELLCHYNNNNGSYTNQFSWRPLEYMMRHKVAGKTTTIQSYNNPKRISGRTWTYKLTNDTSIWTPPSTT